MKKLGFFVGAAFLVSSAVYFSYRRRNKRRSAVHVTAVRDPLNYALESVATCLDKIEGRRLERLQNMYDENLRRAQQEWDKV